MPSIRSRQNSKSVTWEVRWRRVDEPSRSRAFATEDEARAFMATLPPRRRSDMAAARAARRNGERSRRSIESRITSGVVVDDNGCWLWQRHVTREGYGSMGVRQDADKYRMRSVHRVAYEVFVGPIPDGLVLDHLCRVRHCVNPEHLEPVTQRENVMRSPIAPGAINAAKTHCPQGHPYDEVNTLVTRGRGYTGRLCRACQRANSARSYAKGKAS